MGGLMLRRCSVLQKAFVSKIAGKTHDNTNLLVSQFLLPSNACSPGVPKGTLSSGFRWIKSFITGERIKRRSGDGHATRMWGGWWVKSGRYPFFSNSNVLASKLRVSLKNYCTIPNYIPSQQFVRDGVFGHRPCNNYLVGHYFRRSNSITPKILLIDGSLKKHKRSGKMKAGVGWACLPEHGTEILGGGCKPIYAFDVLEAEALALMASLKWATNKGFNALKIKTDSKELLAVLANDDVCPLHLRKLVYNLKKKIGGLDLFILVHVHRDVVSIAREMAYLARSSELCWSF